MKDLTQIKTGDIGFVYNTFDIKNIDTWISGFVRFFMNFQSYILRRELIKNQHCGIFAWYNGELYFYESKSKGFVHSLAADRFAYKWHSVIIKRYENVQYGFASLFMCIVQFESKYNYLGLLFQLIRQLSFNFIDLEAQKTGIKRTYCSQSVAFIINKMTYGRYCQYWNSTDTQDLFFDKASKIVIFK